MSFFSPPIRSSSACCSFSFRSYSRGAQHLHRGVAVAVLRALVLARDDDAGRQVRDADRRIGDVDVLAAGAARAEGVDAEVLVGDLHLDVLGHLRVDEDRGERGVAPRRLIERRDAHQPMHAGLGRHAARTRTRRSRVIVAPLMPASSPGCRSTTSRLKPRRSNHRRYMRSSISAQSCDSVPPAPGWMATMAFRPSCSPPSILRISAASTSVSSSSRPRSRSAATSSPWLGPLDEHGQIVGAPAQRLGERDVLFETAPPLQQPLRQRLVLPEVRLARCAPRSVSVPRPGGLPQRCPRISDARLASS